MTARLLVALPILALAVLPPAGAQHPAPSATDLQALFDRVVEAQHRADREIELYERRERRQVRKTADAAPHEDKTFRVLPTGAGVIRAQLEEAGRAVDPAAYRNQLRDVEHALASALRPDEPNQRRRVAKHQRRVKERRDLVAALRRAYRSTWLGREVWNGRTLARLRLDPDPAFRPLSPTAEYLTHVQATIWLDEAAGVLVRMQADIVRDIAVGGGILAKIYRGSRIVMEQAEAAPGLWLPSRYEYSLTGRKFLFGFGVYETTIISGYRRIGPPAEALAAIRGELVEPGAMPSSR